VYQCRVLGDMTQKARGIETACVLHRRTPVEVSQLEMLLVELTSKRKNEKCLHKIVCINILLMGMNYTEHYITKHYIQSVNKYMLQRSVVDRWVQCDHILLRHPCPETLCLRAWASEM
jgi:hypothetical protein